MKLICVPSAESVAMFARLEITRQVHSAVLFDCLARALRVVWFIGLIVSSRLVVNKMEVSLGRLIFPRSI